MSISEDAVALVTAVAEHEEGPDDPRKGRHTLNAKDLHARYFGTWSIDRFNDAVTEGEGKGWIEPDESLGSHPYCMTSIALTLAGRKQVEFTPRPRPHDGSRAERRSMAMPNKSKVFIIHGRNLEAAKEMGYFVRSLGLTPLYFREVRASIGGTPTIVEIVEQGMEEAQGVIALFTADEFASLRTDFREKHDRDEDIMRWQARPNVIFEAGMAIGRDRSRVVFVLLGDPKLFTDLVGVHVLRPTNDPKGDRSTLMHTLANGMKCAVTAHSTEWMAAGDFEKCVQQLPEVNVRDPFGDRSGSPGMVGSADVSAIAASIALLKQKCAQSDSRGRAACRVVLNMLSDLGEEEFYAMRSAIHVLKAVPRVMGGAGEPGGTWFVTNLMFDTAPEIKDWNWYAIQRQNTFQLARGDVAVRVVDALETLGRAHFAISNVGHDNVARKGNLMHTTVDLLAEVMPLPEKDLVPRRSKPETAEQPR